MIFYFSATGNSKWIAETAAAKLNDTALDITKVDPASYHFGKGDTLGIVFPVFFCTTPDFVRDLCLQFDPGEAYTYVICNFSNYTGAVLEQFSREIFHLDAGYGLLMPDNSAIFGSHYDTEESSIEKLRTAPERLQVFIDMIEKRATGIYNDYEGEDPEESTKQHRAPYDAATKTEGFHVEAEKCVHCGLCERTCPAKAIRLQDGLPVWVKPNCNICLACINRCPTEAIEYKDRSQGRHRYTFEKFIRLVDQNTKQA